MKKTIFTLTFLLIFIIISQTQAASNAYTTFVGGNLFDSITATAVLTDGSIIVVGRSQSADYPTTSGAFDTGCGINDACGGAFATNYSEGASGGSGDGFILRLSGNGSQLL